MQRLQPAGLFGGSFDPPHVGHVALVKAALALLGLGKLWVVPVETPAHRQLSGKADAKQRAAWLACLFSGMPAVEILDWEIGVQAPTPTLPTLMRLRREFPHLMPVLLLGEDAFAGMAGWVGYPEHCRHADVAVFRRAGFAAKQPGPKEWRDVEPQTWRGSQGSGRVIRLEAALPDVAATRIRKMAAAGESVRGMVPEVIRRSVQECYGSGDMRGKN
ncbi:MAG: nicotinate (nicotinamide) nucleotide adenylyltransferase [Mariprofundaceae bacterium]